MEINEATERDNFGSSSVTQTTVHDGGFSKQPEKKRIWRIISETNHWLGRQYTQKTKWRLYSWLVNNEQTTDHDGCKSMNPDDLYHQWEIMLRQTTDHDETISTKPDESYDLGWSSTTHTNVHGGSLSKKPDERFNFGW